MGSAEDTRQRAGLIQQRTQPGFLATEMFSKVIYGDHPASRNSATPASLDAITRDAMVEAHRTRFVPDHAVIAFAGDITLADARKLVETKLGAWKKSGTAETGGHQSAGSTRCEGLPRHAAVIGADQPDRRRTSR